MVNLMLRLTVVVQTALLLLALQNAATPANAFFGRGRPAGADANDLVPRVADVSTTVFEHADVPAKRDDTVVYDDEEEEEYDELEIITVFLPEEGEDAGEENALHKRAGPTPCPAAHTRRRRRSLAVQTPHPHDKRDPNPDPRVEYKNRTRTKTVTVTRTIYETVYRRCTEYIRRANKTTQKRKPNPEFAAEPSINAYALRCMGSRRCCTSRAAAVGRAGTALSGVVSGA